MRTWIEEKIEKLDICKIDILDYKDNYKVVVPECLNKDFNFYSKNTKSNYWLGAFVDNENVGVMFIGKSNYEPGKLHLYEIETVESWQGNGIASTMINWLKDYSKSRGYKGITLRAFEPSLISYYKKFGFKEYTTKDNIEYMSLSF